MSAYATVEKAEQEFDGGFHGQAGETVDKTEIAKNEMVQDALDYIDHETFADVVFNEMALIPADICHTMNASELSDEQCRQVAKACLSMLDGLAKCITDTQVERYIEATS